MSQAASKRRSDGEAGLGPDPADRRANDPVLELRDVAVRYDGQTVLDVPHLVVSRGETLTLLGENGSGKTTLLRVLGLLMKPRRGQVFFHGQEVDFGSTKDLLGLRRRVAGVMQEPLLCRMTVRQNVGLGLRFRGLPGEEINRRVGDWLSTMSILHLGDRPAGKLSGGEARRTSLARAMVLDPEVLFLDEPFAALDAPTRQSLMREFKQVLAQAGMTTVFATHDRGEAVGLEGRIGVLVEGLLAQVGTVEDVFSRPERPDVARFVGIETMIPGRVVGVSGGVTEVDCNGTRLFSDRIRHAGEHVHVAIRPEEIRLHRFSVQPEGDSFDGGAHNVLSGRIVDAAPSETHYRVEVDVGFPLVAVVSRARFRTLEFEEGSPVRASFSPQAAHLILRESA